MRYLLILLGSLSLLLAIIGVFIPLLPTTPLLLLSAALYFRSSPRLYERLLNHKIWGPYIRQFREERSIPLRAKIVSVTLVWVTLVFCAYQLRVYWWLSVLLLLLAFAISWHILSYRTLRK